mgnify:CR=1 FL=1
MARRKVNRPTKKKLLTIDDLYSFYLEQNKTCKFSSEESGYQLSVQVPAYFEVSDEEDDTLLFCTVKLMHSGENRNHSNVTDEALTKAAKGLAYKPILANFMEYTDEETGETLKDFTSHDMVINDDGTATYLEKQVGCFTADEPYFEIEEETGHNFLYGICAIPREYTDTCSIIERKNGTKISVELAVNSMEFDASKKVLNLTDVVILGATLLGKDPKTLKDVGEGMKNARLDIADFSTKNNSIFADYKNQMIELQERLEKLETACFNKDQNNGQNNNTEEGGNNKDMDKFNELLSKYGKTAEDIDFEYEGLTDEELEAKFEEVFGEKKPEEDDNSDDNGSDGEPSDKGEGNSDTEDDTDTGVKEDNACGGGSGSTKKKKKNAEEPVEDMVRTFTVSHEDIRYALYNLLDTVSMDDNDWYCITSVFDDYFVYESWNGGKIFGQKYTKENDNVAFDGDRYELFREYITADEKAQLDDMRSNYSSIVEELNTYKSAEIYADKMTVFDDEAYADYLETDEFKALMSDESVNQYSKEELAEKADATLGKLVKKNKTFSFASTETKKRVNRVAFNAEKETEDTYKPYGDLFD